MYKHIFMLVNAAPCRMMLAVQVEVLLVVQVEVLLVAAAAVVQAVLQQLLKQTAVAAVCLCLVEEEA